jgi:hypothetical protein
VLFQFTGAPEPEELQVTDATDGSVVFWVKNEGFAEQAWMLDDLQVRVGSPIAKTLSLFCNNVIAYTPTLVGFIPPNSSGLIPYQLTDETELAPFSSAVLTNPSGQRSYEVNVGVGEHNVRAYPGPRCPNSLFHGQSFAFHRLQ